MPTRDVNLGGQAVEFRRSLPEVSLMSRDYLTVGPVIDWLKGVAPAYVRGVLLDFGCGNKPYAGLFAAGVDKYIGVDVEQNIFGTVDIVLLPGSPLPMPDRSVDSVLSTQVLEHVAEPAAYLDEIARVLKPGGHCVLTCPASFMLHEEPHDYFRFTKYGIVHLLEKCGLSVVRIDTAGGAWRLMGQIFLNHKAFARKFSIPVISKSIMLGWIVAVNGLCSVLDKFNTNAKDTANYMIIARK